MSASDTRQVARLLIVERDEAVARICTKALQDPRFELQVANSPAEAWKIIASWRPQFYLVGDEFDDCLGLEFCGQLRGRTNAPIMVLMSGDSTGLQVNLLEAGADDVMVRPFAGPLLLAKANSLMRRSYRYSVPPMAPRPSGTGAESATSASKPAAAAQVATVSNSAETTATTAAPKRGINLSSISSAPVTPEALAPDTSFSSWPRCEACGYMGPNERFMVTDSTGATIRACPACNAVGRMRVPKRK